MAIGELSSRTGASVRALRYYEQHGLLRSARTAAGHRRFPPADVETVRRIRLLLNAGFPLADVAWVIPCFDDEGVQLDACVADRIHAHLLVVEERMAELGEQQHAIHRLQQLVRA
ncbi:MerR family transcriptional regulator [Microbacterium sp. NEAU-LLC]|uniref:MerR family transcriptional regulator n=1 Tax=Microbacterium helvum TaxID=2773713 RepID=A0ABR8NT45_9MICO|nr:MerR family transcriptional regulator [Microbacterium helvum]